MADRLSVAPPAFTRATVSAPIAWPRDWLPKFKPEAERLARGVSRAALRLTVCGLPAALSTTLSISLIAPPKVQVKATVMVQLAPAASEVPQLSSSAKVLELVLMLEIVSGAPPIFVRVTACDTFGVLSV